MFAAGEDVWSLDVLDYGLTQSAELWGLLQPYEHIVAGRNAYGTTLLILLAIFSDMLICLCVFPC